MAEFTGDILMHTMIPPMFNWTVIVTRVKQLGILLLFGFSLSALWLGQGEQENWEIMYFTQAGSQAWTSHVVDVDQRIIYDSAEPVEALSDAISPDERYMVIGGSNDQRVLVDQETDTRHVLGRYFKVEWSPNGDFLVLFNGINPSSLYTVHLDIDGIPAERELLARMQSFNISSFHMEWLSDGLSFLINGATDDQSGYGADIYRINSATGDIVNLTDTPSDDQLQRLSPDSMQIAFTSSRSGGNQLFVMAVDGSQVRQLTDDSRLITDISWSPDGTRIAYFDLEGGFHHLRVVRLFDDGTYEITDPMLTEQIEISNTIQWSPDNTRIAYTTVYGELYVMHINGDDIHRLTPIYGELIIP